MRRRILALVAVALAASLLALPTTAAPSSAAEPIVELPVTFNVQNTNHTPVPCLSDNKTYAVKGHIVAPASALETPRAATLYLHAVTWGEYYWRFKGVPNYDYATQQAESGHVSVTVDRIGYGATGRPEGNLGTCFGSEADVAHQIVQDLRHGDYELEGHEPVSFSKIFTAGASVGGLTAHIEAYTFHDVDGLINFAWGDFAISAYTAQEFNDVQARCAEGGDAGSPGYAAFFKNSGERFYFYSATKDVRRAVPTLNPDPCGQLRSIPPGVAADVANLARIDVPVLAVFGENDDVFPPPAGQQEAARYVGSPDVTLKMIPKASHYPLVEATHLEVVSAVAEWLDKHS
jgi:pimeloyl-ACP methyl ester carboxylesterase